MNMALFLTKTVFIVLNLLVAAGSAKYMISDTTQTLNLVMKSFEPRCEKTGFRLGPTQTGLYSNSRWLEVGNFGFR